MGIGEAHRLHRPVAQRLAAAFRHHLDRQAAVEIGRAFPFLEAGLVAGDQRIDEGIVLLLGHRAVDIVLAGSAGADLVVARLKPADVHVDRLGIDDRRDGVEEGERIGARFRADRFGKTGCGQRAGRDDGEIPIFRRQTGDFFAHHRDQRMSGDRRADRVGEAVTVDRKRTTRRHLVGVGGFHDQRAGKAHFRMQHANRVAGRVIRAEGIGTDEFGKAVGLVRVSAAHAAHLMQDDRYAGFGDLPGGFRSGKAAADDVDGGVGRSVFAHGRLPITARPFVPTPINENGALKAPS